VNIEYDDIRERIPEPPKWWDEYAVPRYCEFVPHQAADMYAYEAALVLIECQGCATQFHVCISGRGNIAEQIRCRTLHYGDPPNVRCCLAGPTMNCIDLQVVQFWRRDAQTGREWVRDPTLEVELEGRK
jgi:hypothetical protein